MLPNEQLALYKRFAGEACLAPTKMPVESHSDAERLEQALISLISDTSPRHIDEAATSAAQDILFDGLATGVAGAESPYQRPLLKVVEHWGKGATCRVLGQSKRLPPASAAFMNAFQMHCLEFDAVHETAVAHVATAPIAALLAALDECVHEVSGTRLLNALCVGIEVAATLGVAADAPLGFFRPATTGVFGAAAAVASLRGFDAARAQTCLAYALSFASGTMQPHEEGMPTLPIQLAQAARAGLMATELAEMDIPTSQAPVSGRFGYLAMFESKVSLEGLEAQIAAPWRVTQMSIKPFPSGRATHGGVEATLRLREQGLRAACLESLELAAPPLINQLVNRPSTPDMNSNYARLCFPYVAAVALRRGQVGIEDFSTDKIADPNIRALADKVSMRTNQVTDPAAFTPQRLVAKCSDGSTSRIDIQHLLGSPEHRLSAHQLRAKANSCLTSGGLGADHTGMLSEAIAKLVTSRDCRKLHHCLNPVTNATSNA